MLDYQGLIRGADRIAARLTEHYREHLVCRPGCAACCRHDLSLFRVEAAVVRAAVLALDEEMRTLISVQAQDPRYACPLLIDDRCSIYRDRPLICRTQGLPLLIEADDGEREVDFCPLNFTSDRATDCLEDSHLVPLEDLNTMLVLANLAYCRQNRIERKEAGERRKVSEIVLWTL